MTESSGIRMAELSRYLWVRNTPWMPISLLIRLLKIVEEGNLLPKPFCCVGNLTERGLSSATRSTMGLRFWHNVTQAKAFRPLHSLELIETMRRQ